MKTLLGGADERRRTMSLPLPPPGHAYSLRCGGSYVPLLVRRPSTAEIKDGLWGYASVVVSRTDAEGLGFLELVEVPALRGGGANANPDPAAPGGSSRRSAAKPPIFTLPVFLTPDADLHAELDGAARLVDAVPLFNLGAALAAGAPDEDADAWSARDAASFHAACACASQGWSVALSRALDATFQTNPNEPGGFPGHGNGEHARVPGRVSPPFGFNPTLRGDRMSEGTDTATESSGAATPGAAAAAPSTRSGNLRAAASTDSRRSSRRRRTFCGGARSRPARGSPRSSARRAPPGRARRCASRWRRRFAARASPPSATL